MATPELNKIYQMIDSLSDREKWLLFEYVSDSIQPATESGDSTDQEEGFTEEEIKEMLKPKKPLTGKEMVERGFVGGWEDMGIEDSVEWVAQQRKKHDEERRKRWTE